jgi:predicted thioesterase
MLSELSAGESYTLDSLVEEKYCTTRGAYQIFSTPDLVLLVEAAGIELLDRFIGEGQSSVGSKIDIAHSAPTLLGQRVSITATVSLVDRRRVVFDIEGKDDANDTIVTGTHERFVVDLDKFSGRLAEKASAVAAAAGQAG